MLTTSSSDTDLSAARILPEVFNSTFFLLFSLRCIRDMNSDVSLWSSSQFNERKGKEGGKRRRGVQGTKCPESKGMPVLIPTAQICRISATGA